MRRAMRIEATAASESWISSESLSGREEQRDRTTS
jgi:hypothetical protein